MITGLSHVTIFVTDQEKALEIYTQKLGFELRTDLKFGDGPRFLTVAHKNHPDLELVLTDPKVIADPDLAAQVRARLEKGQVAPGVLSTDDCQKTYEELRAQGIEFLSPPQQKPFGIEAMLLDGCGNAFSLVQPTRR